MRDLQHAFVALMPSYTEKKAAMRRSYRRGQDRGKVRRREQKQQDLDESEWEARQYHASSQECMV